MTTAKSTGVISGTSSSRGVRALSESRRRASVVNAVVSRGACGLGTLGVRTGGVASTGSSVVVISISSNRGSRGDGVAGEPHVHIVQCGLARRQTEHGEAELIDR